MGPDRSANDLRVLLLAPTARDGEASRALLGGAAINCALCRDLPTLCREVRLGAAAAIVPEEVVLADGADYLAQTVRQQAVWSDLPIIVLSRSGVESPAVARALATLGNVSVIERPVRMSTLLSVVRAALRARERQYQARDQMAAQERAERAVREARDAAEAANAAKDQFLAVLSHELRTPLSPVVMSIGAMKDDPELPQRLRDELAMVQRNIELEAKLIDDLLDVSRVTSGKLRLRAESVAVHGVLRHVLEVCASDLATRRLEVSMELGAQCDHVVGDPARLQQVFWNLLKNAIKFSPDGERIAVRTRDAASGCIRVEVQDRGVGIAADVLPRLFNAFEQGDPQVTRQFGGLGLGLAISKAVVDQHGGSIQALSGGAGTGATFVVELATARMGAPAEPAPAQRGAIGRHRLRRLLLVEDHTDTAKTLSRLLAEAGYSVRMAHSVAGALEAAAREPFDIVVSDIGLPDATGYDLMREISGRYGIKGIALSGYGMDDDLRKSKEAGFVDHVVKPVNLDQLEAVLARVAGES